MRTLTDREKRTIRFGAIGLTAYLVLCGGAQVAQVCQRKCTEYQQLARDSENLQRRLLVYEDKAAALKKLMEGFKLDPASLSRTTVVARASAAIQRAAASEGLQVGPVRESPGRSGSKELASLQMEVAGPVPAVNALLSRLENVGCPVILESVLFTSETARPGLLTRPGLLKLNLTLTILDYDEWKKGEAPHA